MIDFPVTFMSSDLPISSEIVKNISFTSSLKSGFKMLLNQMSMIYTGIKKLISGSLPLSSLGGPIAIANVAGDAAKAGCMVFFLTMSLISVNIGMLNLLPIPSLDGGTLLLLTIDAIYGKELPKSLQSAIQKVGIVFLLILIVLVFYNDILRVLTR